MLYRRMREEDQLERHARHLLLPGECFSPVDHVADLMFIELRPLKVYHVANGTSFFIASDAPGFSCQGQSVNGHIKYVQNGA